MEVSCSFTSIVGSRCSYDRRDKSKITTEVQLVSCEKDIESHKSLWCFAGVRSEQELILARAGIFDSRDVSGLTICPFHRAELGTGWRRSSTTCRVPLEIACHTKPAKGDRGIGKETSQVILEKTGILVPVGSGMAMKIFTCTCKRA